MDNIIHKYKESFAQHGDSPKSVFWPKGRQKERFDALTRYIYKQKEFSILDYGCGLSHLYDYLQLHFPNQVVYTGTDIVDDFISENTKKHRNAEFMLIQSHKDILKEYDFIISSGVFSMLYVPDPNMHEEMVYEILSHLFSKCKVFLSVNFMTDEVDFIQEGAYHQNLSRLLEFTKKKLSKRIVIDQSYMPYEYTITIFKDQQIIRPENLYSND